LLLLLPILLPILLLMLMMMLMLVLVLLLLQRYGKALHGRCASMTLTNR
jgi:hypothetical protein